MIRSSRALRQLYFRSSFQHSRHAHQHPIPFSAPGPRVESFNSPSRAVPRIPRAPTPERSAVDPSTFIVATALAIGVAYIATKYTSEDASHKLPSAAESGTIGSVAPGAQQLDLTMAQLPPGRPGNLTADQEAKLKEMWTAVLDVFGVSNEPHANGTSTPTSTPDGKKKKKGRLSMFRRDKKDADGDSDMGDSPDNDKHGQTKEFQHALASQSPEALRDAFWSMSKHDHPDALLLRFLRARKWDVHAALVMMISTMHWRSQEMHVDDDIVKTGEGAALRETTSSNLTEKKEGEDFMAQLRMGKSFLHGTDKEGRPCCWVRVRLHRQGEQSERSLERFTVYTIETCRLLLRPPVDTATIVFDMTDFTMANMDYTPVKFMIKCFEANYPESLGSVLVYKAPWIFQGIWKIIKGWLDPVVASKVHFASHVDDLQEWIPRDQIMKEVGGHEDFIYKYAEPVEGEDAQMADTETRDKILAERKELVQSYETETLAWVHGEDSGEGRGRLAQRLEENYWRADPYIRARSLYDRTGVIGKDGKLEFYPSAQGAALGGGHKEDELD